MKRLPFLLFAIWQERWNCEAVQVDMCGRVCGWERQITGRELFGSNV